MLENEQGYMDWCLAKEGEVYCSIFSQIKDYDNSYYQNGVTGDYMSGLTTYYSNPAIAPARPYSYKNNLEFTSQLSAPRGPVRNNFNITAVCIDTLCAKLASDKAVPQAVTFKGNAKGRRLAEELNSLLKGIFHTYDVSQQIVNAFKHAMINRVGYLKVVKDELGVSVEPVFSDEVIVDTVDSYYNNPNKMIQRKLVPKHIMLLKYPEFKDKIEACQVNEIRNYNAKNYTPAIMVAEAWCKKGYLKKGRHVISIESADLLDEEWDKDYFPILKCDYNPPVIGYMGQSLVDELAPIQEEINRILVSIQAILKLMSVPRIFIDSGANVNKNHITNRLGIMIEYNGKTGAAPIIHNGASLAPEIMQSLEFQVAQAYARVGLTDVDTQGSQTVGSGNLSNEALKTMTNIRSERWQYLKNLYEDKHVELAHIILNELRGEKIKIPYLDRQIGMRQISSEVIPDTEDSYVLRIFPVSAMPKSIPDMMDSCERMMQLGLISKGQIYDLLDIPDMDAKVSILTAKYRLIDSILDEMLEEGKYIHPEPYFQLDYALQEAKDQYNWALLNKIPEDRLELLRRFMEDVKTLIKENPPPMPPPPMPPQPMPQAAPQQSVQPPAQQ